MSYTAISDLPSEVRKSLDDSDQLVWMDVYNSAIEQGEDSFNQREKAWMQTRFLDSSRYVCANVSTQVVDAEGDLADVKAYVEAGQKLVEDGGIYTKNHSNKVIGTVWKVEEGVDAKTQQPCVLCYINYFKGAMLFDQSWKEFKNGRTEFSIGSLVKRPERECNFNGCYYRLIPEQWFELSNVDRGINPITYPVDYNDKAKGSDEVPKGNIVEMHDDVCPAKARYLRFKDKMRSYGHDTNYDEDFLLIHGLLGEDELVYMYEEYPDVRQFEIMMGEGEDEKSYTLVCPKPITDMDEVLHSMIHLMMDEQEAIQGYNTVMTSLKEGGILSEDQCHNVHEIFEEIIHDEEKHIGGILETIKQICPDMYSKIAEGMKESEQEAKKGECPAGQHEHAGVWGCHDIFRKHHIDDKTNPTDKLDLTDENIDVNAIQDAPTEKLQAIVKRVAQVLSRFSDDKVQAFLATTPGKEFVLAFLELKRRKMNGENNMTEEKDAGCSTEAVKADEPVVDEAVKAEPTMEEPKEPTEEDKGMIPDTQSSIANIQSTLASITAVIDQINIRLMKLEDSATMNQDANNTGSSITDAIMSEATTDDASGANGIPPANMGGEDKGDVPPQFEKESSENDAESEDMPADGSSETEASPADSNNDDKPTDDDKSKDDSEDKPKEEPKEDSKDDSKEDSKDDSKEEPKNEDDSEDKKKKEEKDKGTSSEAEPATEVQPAEEAPQPEAVDAVAPTASDAEPPVEEAKQVEPAVTSATSEEAPAQVQPVEAQPVVDDTPVPIPSGGQAVDFRAMLLKRQEEVRAKGVELFIAEDGAQNSLANEPIARVKGTNVRLIQPSREIGAFDVGQGIASHSTKDALSYMGKMDSTNFLRKLIG